jgi:hypothetical protein
MFASSMVFSLFENYIEKGLAGPFSMQSAPLPGGSGLAVTGVAA